MWVAASIMSRCPPWRGLKNPLTITRFTGSDAGRSFIRLNTIACSSRYVYHLDHSSSVRNVKISSVCAYLGCDWGVHFSLDNLYSRVMKKATLLAVVGTTASGKSGLAMELARRFDGEIIAADSRTIYTGMDIGTAKPSAAEQAEIAHWGLDLVEPGQRFTVADYQAYANEKIADITARGKLPIMVGGTGLYVDSVLFGYDFRSDQQTAAKRQELDDKTTAELLGMIPELDRQQFEQQQNRRHIIRFLETGEHASRNTKLRKGAVVIGLAPSKNVLRKRIEKRVEIMFKQGLRKEVDELIERYGWGSEALTGIGYREFKPFYDGVISMSQVKRDIAQSTLRYAKRQRTWFKRNSHIQWHEDRVAALSSDILK